jgi:serine/threonine protein phosphatase PrpC
MNFIEKSADPQSACKKLIDAANEAGGEDNISVVVVQVL